jgi:uncharacterized protein (TIGR04255 family)
MRSVTIPYDEAAVVERPSHLPDYSRPPLVEVAIGVQFEPLHNLRQVHIGLYWLKIRDQFPRVLDQPPLPPIFETTEEPLRPAFRVELSNAVPISRSWFVSQNDEQLIQLQADRIVHNWRGSGDGYPHYEALQEAFEARWYDLRSLVEAESVGVLVPRQVELNYINRIEAQQPHEFLSFVTAIHPNAPGVERDLHESQTVLRFGLQRDGRRVGALYVDTKTAPDGSVLTLTARSSVPSGTFEEAVQALDQGREAIVETFTQLTTKEMHNTWGRFR